MRYLFVVLAVLSSLFCDAYDWSAISREIMQIQNRNHQSCSSQYYYKLRTMCPIYEMLNCHTNDTIYFIETSIDPRVECFPLSYSWKNSNINQFYIYDDTSNNLGLLFPSKQIGYITYINSNYSDEFDYLPGSLVTRSLCVKWDKKALFKLYQKNAFLSQPMPNLLVTRIILKKNEKYKISFFIIRI